MNNKIASYFLTDARDFLSRYSFLRESATHIGLRSKLLIELFFATECTLKALIFLESEMNEKETYKKVKKIGHRIASLINYLSKKSQDDCKSILVIDIDEYEVYNRYLIESEIDFRGENGELGSKYYTSIGNPKWMNEIYDQTYKLIEYVDNLIPEKFEIVNLSDIDIEKEIAKHKIITEIRKK